MAKKVYIGVGQTENVAECPRCGSKSYGWRSDVTVECSDCGYKGSIDEFETVAIRNVARAVKNIYVGAAIDVPQYEESVQNVRITADNITDYFTVTNGAYYFAGSGGVFTSNNKYRGGSTASTVLTAKKSMTNVHFTYSWSSESRYDTFTLKVNGTTVENAVSGATTTKQYTGDLAEGQTIEFKYSKDSSQDGGSDICTFSNMSCDVMVREQTSVITTQNVARKVKKGYVGVDGVARVCFTDKPFITITVFVSVRVNHEISIYYTNEAGQASNGEVQPGYRTEFFTLPNREFRIVCDSTDGPSSYSDIQPIRTEGSTYYYKAADDAAIEFVALD